ncbi:MAG: thermonuclease family protein, partial [Desulfovermiculus sp.]
MAGPEDLSRLMVTPVSGRPALCGLCVIALLLTWSPSPAHAGAAFVLWVTDGDSLTVIDRDFRLQRIRVYGIDCPESDQPFGFKARMKTAWEVWCRPVILHPVEEDRYGRLVARVQRHNTDLSAVLVSSGLAWVYDRYCRKSVCRKWSEMEGHARQNEQGLWSESDPVPPWDWRQGERPD